MTPRTLIPALSAAAVALCLPVALAPCASAAPAVATSQVRAAAYPVPPTATVTVGDKPYDVAISQRRDVAYVVNAGSVSEISLRTHAKVAEYPTGGQDQNAIALVQNDSQAYITDFQSSSVAVVDTRSRTVVKQIPVGAGAVDVAAVRASGPDLAYVAFVDEPKLVGINTRTGTVTRTVTLPEPAQTLTAAPGGGAVWAGSSYQGRIFVVDATTGTVSRTIDVAGVGPVVSIAFAPDRKHVWVVGLGGVAVLGLDGSVQQLLPLDDVFPGAGVIDPGTIALDRSGTYAYVENSTFPDAPGQGSIAVIDTRTFAVVAHIPTGTEPLGFAIDTVRGTVYVPNYVDGTVTYFSIPR